MNEQAPDLCNDYRLRVSVDGYSWLCLSSQPDSSETCISLRRRVGRIHGNNCNRVRSVPAERPQLGTVAHSRVDGVPRGHELGFTAETAGSLFIPGLDCLFSLPT